MNQEPKTIFEYDNFRHFLKDTYLQAKSGGSKFSFRYFSRIAGFRSPNFLKLVIDGQRNLTPESIVKVAKALKLNKDETYFFRHLVLLNQATTADERKIHAEQLLHSKKFRKVYPLKESEFNYYTHWYFVPVRELVNLKGFKEDPAWIARQLNPSISLAEAKKALIELEKLGLIKRNSKGRLVVNEVNVETANEVTSPMVAGFHKEMLNKAAESIDRFSRESREISAVTVGVSDEGMKRIKELIQNFRQEIMAITAADAGATQVYQMGFQLFPLTNDIGTDENGTDDR